MTVKELKEELNKYDDNLRVYLDTNGVYENYIELVGVYHDNLVNDYKLYEEEVISLTAMEY